MVFGLIQSSPWPDIIWRACIGAYIAGLLLKWWGRIWLKCIREAEEKTANSGAIEIKNPTANESGI